MIDSFHKRPWSRKKLKEILIHSFLGTIADNVIEIGWILCFSLLPQINRWLKKSLSCLELTMLCGWSYLPLIMQHEHLWFQLYLK